MNEKPASPLAVAPSSGSSEHRDHGRGDESGPFEPDCPCRGTPDQTACAEAYCGFCRAEPPFVAAARLNDRREDRVAVAALDNRADKMDRRNRNTGCSYCPPHAGENVTRRSPGSQPRKPKYKDKRR